MTSQAPAAEQPAPAPEPREAGQGAAAPRPTPVATRPTLASRPRNISDRVTRVGLETRPFEDLYHALLVMPWGRFFALLVALYLVANALFACVYWLAGGVENASGWLDCFFFSVQTMATIGYGKLTPQSSFANTLVTAEALLGMLSTAMATGLMFAKFARPTSRVLFSNRLLIGKRDGQLTLSVRMANARMNQIAEAQVRITMLTSARTKEGEPYRKVTELKLVRDRTAIFTLSWTAFHTIDESSPLHGVTPEKLAEWEAEFLVTLIGTDETFASTVHARQMYYADEVAWNMRFADMLTRSSDGRVHLDYAKFNDLLPLE